MRYNNNNSLVKKCEKSYECFNNYLAIQNTKKVLREQEMSNKKLIFRNYSSIINSFSLQLKIGLHEILTARTLRQKLEDNI